MLLWHVKFFLVTDAVRACLYVVMAIFPAVRPQRMMWWHFSVLSLGHVTYHYWFVISVYVVRICFLGLSFCWGIVIDMFG